MWDNEWNMPTDVKVSCKQVCCSQRVTISNLEIISIIETKEKEGYWKGSVASG